MPNRATLAAVLVLLAAPAAGQSLQATAPPAGEPVRLNFAAYAGGGRVVDMQADFALSAQSYRVKLAYQLTGVVGALFHGESTATVDGRFQGDTPVPRELFSAGHFRGQPRVTQIDWQGGAPTVSQLVPPREEDREPVPASVQLNTVDGLSAMALLLRRVAATGRCEGAAKLFDGRRVSELDVHTVGTEALEETGRSSFHGPALRCDIVGHLLAGFQHDADDAAMRQPMTGSVWFARLQPGGAPLPVRITFQIRRFGDATLYLVDPS